MLHANKKEKPLSRKHLIVSKYQEPQSSRDNDNNRLSGYLGPAPVNSGKVTLIPKSLQYLNYPSVKSSTMKIRHSSWQFRADNCTNSPWGKGKWVIKCHVIKDGKSSALIKAPRWYRGNKHHSNEGSIPYRAAAIVWPRLVQFWAGEGSRPGHGTDLFIL